MANNHLVGACTGCDELVADLKEAKGAKGAAILTGAGISLEAPTCAPSADHIRGAFRDALKDATADLVGPGRIDWDFVHSMMPERLMSAFFRVFGFDVFEFLQPLHEPAPNQNHDGLAWLADAGYLPDILTLNFDCAIEAAWKTRTGAALVPCTSFAEAMARPSDRVRLHKPHGTLSPAFTLAVASQKYQNLLFTIDQITTRLRPDLVEWLSQCVSGRTLLVTGYSAGDIDILPALQAVKGIRKIYWNFYTEADWRDLPSKPGGSALRDWLADPSRQTVKLVGPIGDHLTHLRSRLNPGRPSPASIQNRDACVPLRLPEFVRDKAAVLIAGSVALHSMNVEDQGNQIDTILTAVATNAGHLHSYRDRTPDTESRLKVAIAELRAARLHERRSRRASGAYKCLLREVEDWFRRKPAERLGSELTPDQVRAKMNSSAVSNARGARRLTGVFRLVQMSLGWRVKEPVAQRLAAHFMGSQLFKPAIYAGAVFRVRSLSWFLYWLSLKAFSAACEPIETGEQLDGFHEFRRDEVWYLMRKLSVRSPLPNPATEMRRWDDRLDHYAYIASVLPHDIGWTAVHLLQGLRDSAPDGRRGAQSNQLGHWSIALDDYERRGYRAGIAKAQLLAWSGERQAPSAWNLPETRRRLRRLSAIARDPRSAVELRSELGR